MWKNLYCNFFIRKVVYSILNPKDAKLNYNLFSYWADLQERYYLLFQHLNLCFWESFRIGKCLWQEKDWKIQALSGFKIYSKRYFFYEWNATLYWKIHIFIDVTCEWWSTGVLTNYCSQPSDDSFEQQYIYLYSSHITCVCIETSTLQRPNEKRSKILPSL